MGHVQFPVVPRLDVDTGKRSRRGRRGESVEFHSLPHLIVTTGLRQLTPLSGPGNKTAQRSDHRARQSRAPDLESSDFKGYSSNPLCKSPPSIPAPRQPHCRDYTLWSCSPKTHVSPVSRENNVSSAQVRTLGAPWPGATKCRVSNNER